MSPAVLPPRPQAGAPPLDEARAKMLLRLHGLDIPVNQTAPSAAEVVAKAWLVGFPVALKVLGLAHKTEVGGVALGLADVAAVELALAAMIERHGNASFLVERMVDGAIAELVVGITREEPYGLALTIGAGGILAELLRDRVTLLLPATREEVGAALGRLRLYPLLRGYRGRPVVDLEAAIDAIINLAALALDEAARLHELEVNPLILTASAAVVVDALVLLGDPA